MPQKARFKNNFTASKNSKFVEDSIQEMLQRGTINESTSIPKVINSLSGSTKVKKGLAIDDISNVG